MFKLTITMCVLAAGCLSGGGKDACQTQADCVNGYVCSNQVCVADDGTRTDHPGGSDSKEFGDVQAMTSASEGLYAFDYKELIGTTTAGGPLGCSLVRDENASPGTAVALVYAKIMKQGGDGRCPTGNYAVLNDPTLCIMTLNGLYPGCVQYKRWDATGTQVTNRLAIGGYVAVQDNVVSSSDHMCSVDMSATFAGGVTVRSSYSFAFNVYGPEESFCAH